MEGTYLVESMIQQAEMENKLFESLLQVNFRKVQVLKEDHDVSSQKDPDEGEDVKTMTYSEGEVDETVKKKWYEKLADLIKKVATAIANAIDSFFNKIASVVATNKQVFTKFDEALKKNGALNGFPGIENFAAPKLNNNDTCIEIIKKYESMVEQYKLGNWFDSTLENTVGEIKTMAGGLLEKPVEAWNKNGSANFDFAKAESALESLANGQSLFGKTIKELRSIAANPDSILMKLKNSKIKDDVFGQDNKLAKAAYSNLREACMVMLNANKNYIKALRHAIFACGTYALKKSKGEEVATQEAWVVGIASDQFIDESFAFI